MFIYAGGRRTGKTGKMIEWFLADPQDRIIITPNKVQTVYLQKRIRSSMGNNFPFYAHIVSYYDAEFLLHGSRGFLIGVENLDMLLNQLFNNPVEFATTSGVRFDAPEKSKPWWRFW